ncbi:MULTISPECIES: tetratricopeptide repeat-containing sulfotransferase family protein [unclassified Novosphingobium]|uniref:tetratricopeptide repeat-containing sulfotransferase family protein n=1 Tax=unclassified Novosphingobium TaxID=2644732 RepID=UPI001358C98F|nr:MULTISPECIES: tetratricopeptide repeat-containing sulfotransferase family protein [unclassified Novosphingobium]
MRKNSSASFSASRRAKAHAAIENALAAGDIARAAELAEAALAKNETNALFLNLAAWRREEAGDYLGAHRLLQQALALAPGDVMVLGGIGAVLRKEGRLEKALAVLNHVVAAEPRHAAAWLERGYTLDSMREEAAARDSYLRALAIDPQLAPALGRLADAAAKRGEAVDARELARRALALQPHDHAATCALATLAIEAGDGAGAEHRLAALLGTEIRGDDRTRALTLMGDALDRQGKTEQAFVSYAQAQDNFRSVYAPILGPAPDRRSHRTYIETIMAQVEAAPKTKLPSVLPPTPGQAATHVFLLGYPRSGTTLVENVLASAPGVIALEERDTLADTDDVLVMNDGTMPNLDALDPSQVAALRAAYWRRVTDYGGDVVGKHFVDMNPLGGIKLPIIARLFPEARILVMRRDPRDIVLSCFRINFTPSPAAWAFSDLTEAASHYAALMQLTERCRERLPLAFHEVRYDRLVADFENTVRAMAAFVGLEWTEAFRRFDRTAQARGVQTASVTQVRRGLYDGRGQWHRYAAQLAPALPILAPWVEKFGFEP